MNALHEPFVGPIFFVVMGGLILAAAWWGVRRGGRGVDQLVTGGHRAGLGLIAVSVMMSWTWTTTLLASPEAGMWLGLTGGLHYAWGAMIPFLVFIPLALRLKKMMPAASTFTEFVRERYGGAVHVIFLLFGSAVAFYVFTEQLIGAGILFETTFGVPYRLVVVATAALVTFYITLGGIRGSLLTDVFQFFVLALASLVVLPAVLFKLGGPNFLYQGLVEVATNPAHPQYDPEALSWLSTAGWRYGLAAVVIAMGQVLFEQGYYQRAIAAASRRELCWGYVLGGIVAWFPVPLAYGTVLGHGGLALGWAEGNGLASTTEVGPQLVAFTLGSTGAILFAAMTFMAATSTADTSLAGVQSLLTVDVYERFWPRRGGDEAAQLLFGRVATVLFGVAGVGMAIAAEGVSLLKFDIMSGILFAAPVGAFVLGMLWKKASASAAVISIAVGLAAGLGTWAGIDDPDVDWFWGNIVSLVVPVLLMLVLSPLTASDFNYSRLRHWRPRHAIEGLPEEPPAVQRFTMRGTA